MTCCPWSTSAAAPKSRTPDRPPPRRSPRPSQACSCSCRSRGRGSSATWSASNSKCPRRPSVPGAGVAARALAMKVVRTQLPVHLLSAAFFTFERAASPTLALAGPRHELPRFEVLFTEPTRGGPRSCPRAATGRPHWLRTSGKAVAVLVLVSGRRYPSGPVRARAEPELGRRGDRRLGEPRARALGSRAVPRVRRPARCTGATRSSMSSWRRSRSRRADRRGSSSRTRLRGGGPPPPLGHSASRSSRGGPHPPLGRSRPRRASPAGAIALRRAEARHRD